MKIALSKREKKLLYSLLIVCILCFGIFVLLLPTFDEQNQLKLDKTAAETELLLLKAQAIDEEDLDKKLADAQAALAQQKELFYTNYKAEDVDALLTALVFNYGMTPLSMNIGEIVQEELYSYEDYKKVMASETNETTAQAKKINVCNVSMQVKGSTYQIQSLIDAANSNGSLRVGKVTYSLSEASDTMSISFKLYLI